LPLNHPGAKFRWNAPKKNIEMKDNGEVVKENGLGATGSEHLEEAPGTMGDFGHVDKKIRVA